MFSNDWWKNESCRFAILNQVLPRLSFWMYFTCTSSPAKAEEPLLIGTTDGVKGCVSSISPLHTKQPSSSTASLISVTGPIVSSDGMAAVNYRPTIYMVTYPGARVDMHHLPKDTNTRFLVNASLHILPSVKLPSAWFKSFECQT